MVVSVVSAYSDELTSVGPINNLTIAGASLENSTEYFFIANMWNSIDDTGESLGRFSGTDVLNLESRYKGAGIEHSNTFMQVATTANPANNVALGIQRILGSGTASGKRMSIKAIKTADLTDFVFDQESSLQDDQHSTSLARPTNIGVQAGSLTSGQRYLCLANFGIQIDATNIDTEVEIADNAGTPARQAFHAYEGSDIDEIYYTALMEVFDGANSATLDARQIRSRDDGAGGKNDYEYGFICRFAIPGGSVDSSNWENGDGAQTDGDVNIGTGATEVQGVVPTVEDSEEYLWLVYAAIDVQNASRSFTAQVQEGGTDLITDLATIDPNDATDELPAFFAKYDTALTPGTDFDLDYDLLADSTTGTPHASYRTAVALQATTAGITNVNLAGNQPASTGAVVGLHNVVGLTGNQPAMAGAIDMSLWIPAGLAGVQGALTGDVNNVFIKALDGSQPAQTGDIDMSLWTPANLTGSQPAQTGILTPLDVEIELAGNQPAQTGDVDMSLWIPANLPGNQPASTGEIANLRAKTLDGSQPASTGDVDMSLWTVTALAGNQPAMTGAIDMSLWIPANLPGNQPESTGEVTNIVAKTLAGNQPAATGEVVGLHNVVGLTGNQPNSTGLIDMSLWTVTALAGNQPTLTGDVDMSLWIPAALAGNQPAMTGVVVALQVTVGLTGNQPAMSGVIDMSLWIPAAFAGNQPAMAGALSVVFGITEVSLTGNQPASAGVLTVVVIVSLAGAQPAPSGALGTILYLIALTGNQPAQTGIQFIVSPNATIAVVTRLADGSVLILTRIADGSVAIVAQTAGEGTLDSISRRR